MDSETASLWKNLMTEFYIQWWEEYRSIDREQFDGETKIEGFFLISDTQERRDCIVLRVIRLEF